jgi:hypothetical protein
VAAAVAVVIVVIVVVVVVVVADSTYQCLFHTLHFQHMVLVWSCLETGHMKGISNIKLN